MRSAAFAALPPATSAPGLGPPLPRRPWDCLGSSHVHAPSGVLCCVTDTGADDANRGTDHANKGTGNPNKGTGHANKGTGNANKGSSNACTYDTHTHMR